MALITCKNCEKQVSDKAKTCPHCGAEITIHPAAETLILKCEECGTAIPQGNDACPNCGCPVPSNEKPKNKKKNVKKILIALVVAVVLIAAAAGVYVTTFSPQVKLEKKFATATATYNSGDYASALPLFEEISTYRNSADAVIYCKYYLGIAAMEAFDWETAITYFDGLNYEDSEKMLTDCSFMIDIEDSVTRRLEINAKEFSDLKTVVNTELAYMEKYRSAEFYDSDLGKLAKNYLDGLDTQLDSLDCENYGEAQHNWQEGLVTRYDVLNLLYDKFGFMADNKDFIATYISQYEDQKYKLDAYIAIDKDMASQQGRNFPWVLEHHSFSKTFTNHTKYSFSAVFEIKFIDKNGVVYETATVIVEDIRPGASYLVEAYISDSKRLVDMSYSWYYYE